MNLKNGLRGRIRYRARFSIAILLVSLFPFNEVSANSNLTYHGRIIGPNGAPLNGNVEFKIQIRTPGEENCLLFEETHTQLVTNGIFALTIGTGTPGSHNLDLEKVFQNRGTLTGLTDCASGYSSYATDTTHGRRLLVSFRDITNGPTSWEDIPETTVNFVPLAIEAQTVGGFNAKHLLRVENGSGPQNAPSFTPSEADELLKLAKGTSTLYLKYSGDTGATLPVYSGNPSSPAQGSIWFDTSTGELKYYDGTTVITVGSGGGGGGGVTSITAGAGLTGGTITTTGTIALEDHGTPGTYYKVTTDAKGRVTSGSATLDAADIPSLDWSKIATGKPTDLAGYGITDAVKNAGGVASIRSGNDADKPAAGTAGRVYMAVDTQKIYRDDGTNWIVVASVDAGGGGGSVTEVTVSGAPLSVINGTTTPQISISQAGASSSGYLSQSDWNTFNSKLDSSLEAGKIFIGNASDEATAVLPSGDAAISQAGVITVQGLRGQSVAATAPVDGQVLKFVGGGTNAWTPSNFSIGDLKTTGGVQQFASASCLGSQTLSWNSLTDQFTCVDIEIAASQVTGLGTMATESKDDYLTKAGNLSGLANAATARTNLGFTATGNSLVTATDAAAARTAIGAMAHVAPGASGNVLQSDGSNWVSATLSLDPSGFGSQTQNHVLAAPVSSNGAPLFRALQAGDIPNLDASKITSGTIDQTRLPNVVVLNGGNTGVLTIGTNDGTDLSFKTDNTVQMTVTSDGDVGIGLTSPGSKLSVAGIIESTSGGFKFPDGTTQTTAATGSGTPQLKYQVFTSSGTFVTPAGTSTSTVYKFTVVGAGGGQSTYGAAGGGGAAIFYGSGVNAGTSVPITVGLKPGGIGNGGASSIVFNGTTVTANGGSSTGSGGTASNGTINITGGSGRSPTGIMIGCSSWTIQKRPGSSIFGLGGPGAEGQNGIVIVEWIQ